VSHFGWKHRSYKWGGLSEYGIPGNPQGGFTVRLFSAVMLNLAISCCAFGQTYTINTFAGGGLPVNIPGTSASLSSLNAVAVDVAGNVFFTDRHHAVLRLDATTGVLTVVAGNGTPGYSGDDGPATKAQLNNPRGVAVDAAGNLYIADNYNDRVRKVSNGVITTVAGNGVYGYSGDNGPATSAQVSGPNGVALDAAGNLYIADTGSHHIRKVSNGVITTVAGNGVYGYGGDNGPAISAQVFTTGVAVDSMGNLYIADTYNNRIRKVSNGVITTVAGNGTGGYGGDNGPATSAQVGEPFGVAVDAAGNLYIADTVNGRIRKVSNGVITTVAGGVNVVNDNGPATGAQLNQPQGVAVDAAGNLYIADSNRLRKVSNGVIATVAGGGSVADDSGPPTASELWSPGGVAVDGAGAVYIADTSNNRVRKVSNGVISTVAGNGKAGFSGDNGPAANAELSSPHGLAVDSAGALYIADQGNDRIRKVANGVITTVAGNGEFGPGGDNGPATSAQFRWPYSVAVDSAGSLYIADFGNSRIRKVSDGVITTVAGNGTYGYSGDNGPATSAQLNGPWSVAVDPAGNLYVADYVNNRIRRISNGVITTVAGNGAQGYSGDNGPATAAQLNDPYGVTVDAAGNLYISDSFNERIRKVSNGVITTMAGSGLTGPSGGGGFGGDDGPATSARLNSPDGIAVDPSGNLYIADTLNNRVRALIPSLSIGAVANAASNLAGPISPGEIVVLYGAGIGPAQLVKAAPGSDGSYGTQVANASVSFNGIPAPMIYAWASQTAAIVPYGVTGATAQVIVAYQGQVSAAFPVSMAPSAPGIFTYDASGLGPAAAINQDGVTVNTAATPTETGDIISLYATGEGQTTPAGVDGKPASVPYPYPNLTVTATVGGLDAPVKYAGGAPGLVAGLMQVNIQIPSGIQTGDAVLVFLRVGSAFSQGGVTIAVR
jgi:uncharacterized protein (TIGR03437 family)